MPLIKLFHPWVALAEISRKLGGCTSAIAKAVLKKEGRVNPP